MLWKCELCDYMIRKQVRNMYVLPYHTIHIMPSVCVLVIDKDYRFVCQISLELIRVTLKFWSAQVH